MTRLPPIFVMPAQAGIHDFPAGQVGPKTWMPACAGMTAFVWASASAQLQAISQ